MRRFLLLLCVAFPLLGAPDWNTLFGSLVKVEAEKRPMDTGAGIVIFASADSIRVLTAAHVVAKATSLKVYFYSDQTIAYPATVLPKSSDDLDLAVLEVLRPQVRPLPGNIPRLAARGRDTLQLRDHIWTVDSGWITVPNTVTALHHDNNTQEFEYTKGAIAEGFSGGAVFDDDGRLVGIHDKGASEGQYAVAVKLGSAVEVLDILGHRTPNLVWGDPVPSTIVSPPPPTPPRVGDTRVNAKDGLTYVWVPAGDFTMGCSPGDTECLSDEKPAHAEQIANGFWLGQTEVTQAAWKKVNGGENPSRVKSDQLPVEEVDWSQASTYCKAIGGRLPTEKEWEYAARADTTGARYGALDDIAWYSGNSGRFAQPVGAQQANAYGLKDMLGNVWEWTSDNYGVGSKVLRGGSSFDPAGVARASVRVSGGPSSKYKRLVGVRCVWELP